MLSGNVPGPVIIGAIFDYSCLVWQDNCGSQGACWVYDNAALSWRLFLVCLVVNVTSGLFFFISVIVHKPPAKSDDVELINTETLSDSKRDEDDTGDGTPYSSDVIHDKDVNEMITNITVSGSTTTNAHLHQHAITEQTTNGDINLAFVTDDEHLDAQCFQRVNAM